MRWWHAFEGINVRVVRSEWRSRMEIMAIGDVKENLEDMVSVMM